MAEACDMMFKDSPERRTFLSGPNCGHFYWGLTDVISTSCIGETKALPSSEFLWWFSSSLCDRMMLRHPSKLRLTRLGEGCSSTAINPPPPGAWKVWNNPANRGSFHAPGGGGLAVP